MQPGRSRVWQVASSKCTPKPAAQAGLISHSPNALHSCPLSLLSRCAPMASGPAPRALPEAGRSAVRRPEGRPCHPAPDPCVPRGPQRPAPRTPSTASVPSPRFPKLEANAVASRDPISKQQTLSPPAQEQSSQSLCGRARSLPAPGKRQPRRLGARAAGSKAQPRTHRGVAAASAAAARAPRRP